MKRKSKVSGTSIANGVASNSSSNWKADTRVVKMTKRHFFSIALTLFLSAASAVLCQSPCHAETIVSPTSYSNNTMGVWSGHTMDLAIDQSGLSSGFTSGVTDLATYLETNPTHLSENDPPNFWVSALSGVGGSVDFDLGSTQTITKFVLWQANEYPDEQIDGFTIFTSNVSDFSSLTNVGSFNATFTAENQPPPAEVFNLTSSSGRYVRLQITSNYGSPGNYVDAGEFAFGVAVPEVTPDSFTATRGQLRCPVG